MLETHMPTGQQATLLRSAQVISVRYVHIIAITSQVRMTVLLYAVYMYFVYVMVSYK